MPENDHCRRQKSHDGFRRLSYIGAPFLLESLSVELSVSMVAMAVRYRSRDQQKE